MSSTSSDPTDPARSIASSVLTGGLRSAPGRDCPPRPVRFAPMATPRPSRRPRPVARSDEHLRLMTKVARLYHERGVNQPEIARRLHVSQARVSRLLKRPEAGGIVRPTVVVPEACGPRWR